MKALSSSVNTGGSVKGLKVCYAQPKAQVEEMQRPTPSPGGKLPTHSLIHADNQ